jgi:DNA topoisomerase-1
MAYRLVIVESPAKAKTIEKYLPDDCHVSATMGHLIDLPKSKLGIDIDDNFKPAYQPVKGKGTILKALKKEKGKADEVILATDPDREGEAISYHLANYLGLDLAQDNRIEFHEITPNAIREAMGNKRTVNLDLVDAQQARRVLDRLVGYQISPVLWKKVMRGLSAGRVQSVAMRMIVDREAEIEAFEPVEFWNISALLERGDGTSFEAKLTKAGAAKAEIRTAEEAKAVAASLEKAAYAVSMVKKSEKRRKPAPPFITSTLQQDAYRKLGFTTKRTMAVAQQLYEGLELEGVGHIGLITYMRTDSVRTSQDAQDQARDAIVAAYGKEYCGTGETRASKKAGIVQDAHEAIRPTDVSFSPDSLKAQLTADQLKLYTLIYRRFLASRMSSAVFDTIAADVTAGEFTLHASGSRMKFAGFLAVYDPTEDKEEESLPELAEGESLKLQKLSSEQKFTQPPPRFTEASLVKSMEEEGIGRPSTYAPTISTIQNRNYVNMEDKKFVPTDLGKIVVRLMVDNFNDIVDVGFTASMEKQLDKIAEGSENWIRVIESFYEGFKEDLDKADSIERVKLPEEETDETCEICGRKMVVKYGRFGKFLACPGYPECKNAKAITKSIEVKCPVCGSDIVERKSKKGRLFYGCKGYPECSWVSWYRPLGKDCPQCGKMLFATANGKKAFCGDKECGYARTAE